MSIRTISVIARANETNQAAGKEIATRLLTAWMRSQFQPVTVSGLWCNQTLPLKPPETEHFWSKLPLWAGEREGKGILTEFPTPDFQFSNTLVSQVGEGGFGCVLHGALYHRPPLPSYPLGWYGRAKINASEHRSAQLWQLAQIALEWSRIDHSVSVRFPIGGYPITRALPPVDSTSVLQKTSEPDIVEANRLSLFGWIASLPSSLGWLGSVEWEINSDDALFDEDIEALREWEQRLNDGTI